MHYIMLQNFDQPVELNLKGHRWLSAFKSHSDLVLGERPSHSTDIYKRAQLDIKDEANMTQPRRVVSTAVWPHHQSQVHRSNPRLCPLCQFMKTASEDRREVIIEHRPQIQLKYHCCWRDGSVRIRHWQTLYHKYCPHICLPLNGY